MTGDKCNLMILFQDMIKEHEMNKIKISHNFIDEFVLHATLFSCLYLHTHKSHES